MIEREFGKSVFESCWFVEFYFLVEQQVSFSFCFQVRREEFQWDFQSVDVYLVYIY